MVNPNNWQRIKTLALRGSPLLIAIALVLTTLLLDEEMLVIPTTILWSIVAVFSTWFADKVRRITKRRLIKAKRNYGPTNPWRIHAEANHDLAVMVEWVHALFLGVGLSILLLPEGSAYGQVLRRDGLLLAQYILFLKIAYTYFEDKYISTIVGSDNPV